MQIYLPIAEVSVDVFLLLAMGAGVGFLSSLFGVGGGFLATPLLIFLGIPPPVAVATQANQIIGASLSGALLHWRRGNVDFKMGLVLLVGGLVGSTAGVALFAVLRVMGQIDLVILVSYVLFLGAIGGLMLWESVRALLRQRRQPGAKAKLHQHIWLHGLPLKVRFRKSKLYISALLPLGLGFFVGILAAIMGVGGGFIMVPAMIYVLGMPTAVVVGTSLFQIIFVAVNVTVLQSIHTHTVDLFLAVVLLVGGMAGAQLGARVGTKLRGEQIRILLGLIVIAVCANLAFGLVAPPNDIYSLQVPFQP
jgi:uncharacterized membrane protein YfcA